MITLAFNTSAQSVSLALFKDEEILDFIENNESARQSELLVLQIENLLKKHQLNYRDLTLIAASSGPGSFTGTRIGITCAKTLQIALKKPLILINNLEAQAFASKDSQVFIALESLQNETFIAQFKKGDNCLEIITSPLVIPSNELENFLPKNCSIIQKNISEISAKLIGEYAIFLFKNNRQSSNDILYLRDPKIGVKTK